MAEHTAERGDLAGAGRGPADLPRPAPRNNLDDSGLPVQTSAAGRRTSQAKRGVVGASHHLPAAGQVPTLRNSTRRTGLVVRTDDPEGTTRRRRLNPPKGHPRARQIALKIHRQKALKVTT